MHGYDSYGNVCGSTNSPVKGVHQSGQDMRDRPYVFFIDVCNLDTVHLRFRSLSLCVARCPETSLSTIAEVQKFASVNGSLLCDYSVTPEKYATGMEGGLCPKLPVLPSKPLPLLHRCVPIEPPCFADLLKTVFGLFNDLDIFQKVIGSVIASRDIVFGLCFLSLVLSIITMLVIRFISAVLVWILTILLIVGSLAGTGIMWWMYAEYRASGNTTLPLALPRPPIVNDNETGLLVYAIAATIFTVLVLLAVLILRKRIGLAVALFHNAGRIFVAMPFLMVQPLWTFIALLLFWVYWLAVLMLLATAGDMQVTEEGFVEYRLMGPVRYLWWYHLIGLIWVSEFILACQQMAIAGAVTTYYFTRNKERLPSTPILLSVKRLVCYHLGTLAKGSLIITMVKLPRYILMYIHQKLRGQENACARYLLKCCICCLWCLEKCLKYLNQNAYAATAINNTSFCTSARDAFLILVSNALRVAAINSVGDFMLILAKALVVCVTCFAGALLLDARRDLFLWVVPLLLSALFAYLVADTFLTVFQAVVDVLFLCFAIDTAHNDGSPGREYFMDRSLMEYVKNSEKAMAELDRKRRRKQQDDGKEGRDSHPGAASAV